MKKILIFVLMIFAIGCSKKYVTSPTTSDKPEKETAIMEVPETVEGVEAKIAAKESAKIDITEMEKALMMGFKDILFDFDKYDLRPDVKPTLRTVADWMFKDTSTKILIEGHCDERGTNEYNLALGDRRAQSTKKYLLSLGVSSSRMEAISYGEEKPLCAEQTEDCWAKNRRAHFIVKK